MPDPGIPTDAPSAEQLPNAPTPADLAPRPRWWERLAWYLGAMLLSCIVISAGLRLDQADLRAPFYYDLDSLLILPMVKATVESGIGGHWKIETMGAPGVLELYDFPVIDHLHFVVIWLLGQVVSNLLVLYNLYFLLTFPITVLTTMIAVRHLGLSLPAAAAGGLLYSFLPFHYQRWENHYFLAAYWMVPLALLPAFAVCKGDLPFFRRSPEGTYRRRVLTWGTLGQVVLAAATASAGAYYAFFVCAVLAFAGVYSWAAFRTWRGMASASGVIGFIMAFGLANHLPTFLYQREYGVNAITVRAPEEADMYGLKITHLILPIEDHNLTSLRRIKAAYNSPIRPSENENKSASLGVVGTAGLLGLVVVALLPFRRPWPYGPLAGMTLFLVLLGTIGGFGPVFNLLVTASIRGYNRISVVIAFLCFLAALWAIDRFLLTRTTPRIRRLRYPAWATVLLLGLFDQTPFGWFRAGIVKTIDEQASRFRADADFFKGIQKQMPAGSRVFCVPYIGFPEVPPLVRMPAYEHARGYIHSDGLVWSFGAMKGREVDAWQADVSAVLRKETIARFLQRIVARGFDGLLIDGRGFPPAKEPRDWLTGPEVLNEVNQIYARELGRPGARLPEIIHDDRQQFFLDLRPYRDLYLGKNAEAFEAMAKQEREWVAVVWVNGFYSPEPAGFAHEYREGPRDGTAWFVNPSDRERTFRVSVKFGCFQPGSYRFQFSGLLDKEFDIERAGDTHEGRHHDGELKEFTVVVPPGRHPLRIRCTPPPDFAPVGYRKMYYALMDFKMAEIR